MLLVGDRVVLRANAPPEAEYILFEIGDIELRSSEPGRVREHGYQTTVERARARLAQTGLTAELARECAVAMQPVLSAAYARGPAVSHVSRYLSPLELFQADHYDGGTHRYRGVFIDLPALVADLDLPLASIALQGLYLAMLLENELDETTVFLSTDAWTKQRKPGERTHRRPNTTAVRDIRTSLGDLAGLGPQPIVKDQLPRADVIAFVRARAETATDDEARELYASLERAVAIRDIPDRGPLAEPELWSIETKLDVGSYDGILEAVEEVERSRGRTPGTTYLRARASLALRLEPPKLIAERVSALALSMTSFQELCLLAAEAWLEAGDPRRAMPYARDLVDAPGIDEGLLLRAKRLLARAVGAAPDKHKTYGDNSPVSSPMPASQRPGPMPTARPSAQPPFSASPSVAPPAAAPLPPTLTAPSLPPISMPDSSLPRAWGPEKSRVPTEREEQKSEPPPPTLDAPGQALGPLPPPLPVPSKPPPLPNRRKPAATERESFSAAALPPSLPPPSSPRPLPSRSPQAARAQNTPIAPPPLEKLEEAQREDVHERPAPVSSLPPPLRQRPRAPDVLPSAPPPPLDIELPPAEALAASFTLELPGPESLPPKPSQPPGNPSDVPAAGQRASQGPIRRRSMMGIVQIETRAPPAFDPRAEPDGDDPPQPQPRPSRAPGRREVNANKEPLTGKELDDARRNARFSSKPPPPAIPREDESARPTPLRPGPPPRLSGNAHAAIADLPPTRPPMPTPALDADMPPESTQELARTLDRERNIRRVSGRMAAVAQVAMHGASLPPFRLENPPPLLAKAPLLPKFGGAADELVEHLPLPAGLGSEPRPHDAALPQSVLEARVSFTLLARELGLDYRLKRGIELRADVSGLEAMQAVLLESFPDHAIKNADDAHELRRHGALLSEILARRLDAEWIDISPGELGYWSMIVPPDTRVWPFGRVARLVEMGHKERDLVSYFFELQSRARGR
jgi:hypothetical protein